MFSRTLLQFTFLILVSLIVSVYRWIRWISRNSNDMIISIYVINGKLKFNQSYIRFIRHLANLMDQSHLDDWLIKEG